MENKYKEFKPYDRVLVRTTKNSKWDIDLYSYFNDEVKMHVTLSDLCGDENILPYEGNEALIGTTDEPEEEIVLENGEKIICSNHISRLTIGRGLLEDFDSIMGECFICKSDLTGYPYAVRFSDFNPNDMEETKKHILCVKNGKIVRYKG